MQAIASPPASGRLFNVVVKTTSTCNLACGYCYSGEAQARLGKRIVAPDLLDAIIDGYARVADAGRGCGQDGRRADFGWHGGEPLLAGKDFFTRALARQKAAFGDLRRVHNGINTNGTLIDESWAELFAANDVAVAVSLDGPPALHDRQRPTRAGGPSHARALRGYQLLCRAGLAPGVVLVVTDETAAAPREIFAYLRELGVSRLAFSPRLTPGDSVDPDRFGDFLVAFFDEWYALGDGGFSVRDFESAVARLLGGVATACEYNECGSYLSVDTDGGVYFCDWYTGRSDHHLGQLPQADLCDVLASPRLAALRRDVERPARCLACRHARACGTGCHFRRELAAGDEDVLCRTRLRLFDHVARRLSDAMVQPAVPPALGPLH